MRWTREAFILLPLCALACRSQPDLTGFTAACLAAPSDAPVELEFEGDRLSAARVPLVPGGLPAPVQAAADREQPTGRTVQAFQEWSSAGEGFRVLRRDEGDTGTLELLVDAKGTVLEHVHQVTTVLIPVDALDAATAGGRLRVVRTHLVRSEVRENRWRLECEDQVGRPFRVEASVGWDEVRTCRIVQCSAAAW
jgi:hypothetical protein